MTKKIIRIVHKKKRSHHKKPPGKVTINLAKPTIVQVATSPPYPKANLNFSHALAGALHDEADEMLANGNPDAARLGLWFLREYRMAHKFWECV